MPFPPPPRTLWVPVTDAQADALRRVIAGGCPPTEHDLTQIAALVGEIALAADAGEGREAL